jgi:hypothetical protein
MRIQAGKRQQVAAIMAALTVITLTACGSGGGGQAAGTSSVASLPASHSASPGRGTASPAAAAAAGQSGPAGLQGVTMPANASPAETARIMNAWASCLQAHGDPDFATKKGPGGIEAPTTSPSKFPAAAKACRSLQPHPPWQEMPQYNPSYQRDFAQWVTCLNARGVPVKAVPGGWNYDGTSSLSPARQEKVTVQCEMRAFHES